ncbi:hypothetical protein N0V93_010255 [Gnomoniopsis smithogilvyi]|uniref:Uncharacterized protein n=1 Tax=Gnomoniopsis smithogilvyi TaxID=1191159 RepID=A0A9W9CS92_9PEZI|nr:hypothetical protein N0V93_010255 [Gnomoniopsis smithogilvyi]
MTSKNVREARSSVGDNPKADHLPERPSLPPNVSIFSPKDKSVSKALLEGQVFSRLTVSSRTESSRLTEAMRSSPIVKQSYFLIHNKVVLVFDAERQGVDDVKDAHHEHVRAVCLALKDADVGLDIAGCVFDSAQALQAGFQFDRLSDGAVMVVDIMSGDDDDTDDEDGLDAILKDADTTE